MANKEENKEKINTIDLEDVDAEETDEYEFISVEDRIISIEKKTNTVLVLVVLLTFLVILNIVFTAIKVNPSNGDTTTTKESATYDTSMFTKIAGKDISTESKNKTIVVMMGRQGCGYCTQYAPILANVQKKNNFTAYYVDLAEIINMQTGSIDDNDSYDALMDLGVSKSCKSLAYDKEGNEIPCSDFMEKEFGATPLTIIVKNNKLEYAVAGAVDEDSLSSIIGEVGLSK